MLDCSPSKIEKLSHQFFSPRKPNEGHEKKEDVTLQIFSRLFSLTDGINRSEIEAALDPEIKDFEFIPSPPTSPIISKVRRFYPFSRETNFSYKDGIQTRRVLHSIFSTIADLLLGWKFSKKQASIKENVQALQKDLIVWQRELAGFYSISIQNKMNQVFDQAQELLRERQTSKQHARMQRVAFYASFMLSLVGKLVHQKALTLFGIIASAVTFFVMVTWYETASFKQTQEGIKLKSLLEDTYTFASSRTPC